MTRNEFIGKLQMVYVGDRHASKEIISEYNRLNNIINELEKYIHSELVLDFYNDDMPCELIINKIEKMIKELKEDDKNE